MPPAETGKPYSAWVHITGGSGPYTFSVSGGSLPPGLTLHPFLGSITGIPTGTPTNNGNYPFDIEVNDSQNLPTGDSYTINVTAPLTISSTSPLLRGVVGSSYTQTITATGGAAPRTFSTSGLPAGLSIDPASGIISGTPTTATTAAVTFSVTVNDNGGRTFTKTFTLNIDEPLAIITTNLNAATAGVTFTTQTLAASGGMAPLTWSITKGSLPPGLVMTTGGVISGTPLISGGALATITIKDAYNRSVNRTFAMDVAAAPTNTPLPPLKHSYHRAAQRLLRSILL
jgi:hypothetical protein